MDPKIKRYNNDLVLKPQIKSFIYIYIYNGKKFIATTNEILGSHYFSFFLFLFFNGRGCHYLHLKPYR